MSEQVQGQHPSAATCPVCGAATLRTNARNLTVKRRPKFGFFWVCFTILTGGLALVAYLLWPRHREVVGVDRFVVCATCGARV